MGGNRLYWIDIIRRFPNIDLGLTLVSSVSVMGNDKEEEMINLTHSVYRGLLFWSVVEVNSD